MTLWYLSNNEGFRQISDRFNVSLSTAHKSITRVMDFLLRLRNKYIVWPNKEEKSKISNYFETKKGFKNCIGAIDGCHITINRPLENEDSYVNRKGYHSILLQGVVDHTGRFIDIYCGEAGSLHDSRLLRKSLLYEKAQNPTYFGQYYLLGDSAYANQKWLVVPFKDNGNLSNDQKYFNFQHSSARIIVEHAFGLLKGRFRKLLLVNNLDLKLCVKIIMVCCVLHNICLYNKDTTDITPVEVEAAIVDDLYEAEGEIDVRDQLFRNIVNNRH